jgi:hypothetical protein
MAEIEMKEALRITRQRKGAMPQEFSVEFISHDSNQHRSQGRASLRRIKRAVRTKSGHNTKREGTFTVKDLDKGRPATIHFKHIMKMNGKWVV